MDSSAHLGSGTWRLATLELGLPRPATWGEQEEDVFSRRKLAGASVGLQAPAVTSQYATSSVYLESLREVQWEGSPGS